jgi:tetratricopeptide (TPR) repeat protein
LLAAAAVVFALGCVYSLAAPWLADRAEASLHFDRAHTYNPLSTRILTEQAAFARTPRRAERYYRDAVSLEPTNAELWYELAQFYADNGRWLFAYRALSRAYTYDPYGLAGRCNGLAAEIRRKVNAPSSCPAGG